VPPGAQQVPRGRGLGGVSEASRAKVLGALGEGAGGPQGAVKVEGGEQELELGEVQGQGQMQGHMQGQGFIQGQGQELGLEPDLEAREAVEDSDEEEEEGWGRVEGEGEFGGAADGFDASLKEKARAMISAAIKVRGGGTPRACTVCCFVTSLLRCTLHCWYTEKSTQGIVSGPQGAQVD